MGRAGYMFPLIPDKQRTFTGMERACRGGKNLNKNNKKDVHERIIII